MANVTLNDFRAVLGTRNDGNIVLNQDGQGFHKVNFGRLRIKMATPENKTQNKTIRELLYQSICNSAQGKVLGATTLNDIRVLLGIENGHATTDTNVERSLVARVLKMVDEDATVAKLINEETVRMCRNGGIASKADADLASSIAEHIDGSEFLASPEMAAKVVCKKRDADFLPAVTDDEMARFIKDNFNEIKARIFTQRYWLIQKLGPTPDTIAEQLNWKKDGKMLGNAIYSLMQDFAQKKTPPSITMEIPPSPFLDSRKAAQFEADGRILLEQGDQYLKFYQEIGAQKAEEALNVLANMTPASSRSARIVKGLADSVRVAFRHEIASVIVHNPGNYRDEITGPGGFLERFGAKLDAMTRFVVELAGLEAKSHGKDGDFPNSDKFRMALAMSMRGTDASGFDAEKCCDVLVEEMQKFSRRYSVRDAIETSIKAKYQANPEDGRRMCETILAQFDGYVNGHSEPAPAVKRYFDSCCARVAEVYTANVKQHADNPDRPIVERAAAYGELNAEVGELCAIVEKTMEEERAVREGAAAGINKAARDVVALSNQQLRADLRKQYTDEEAVAEGRKIIAEFLVGEKAVEGLDSEQLKGVLLGQPKAKIDLAVNFVAHGYLSADQEIANDTKRPGFYPLRELMLDGVVDFAKMSPLQAEQFKLIVSASFTTMFWHQIFADPGQHGGAVDSLAIDFGKNLLSCVEHLRDEFAAAKDEERLRKCQKWLKKEGAACLRSTDPAMLRSATSIFCSELGLGNIKGFKNASPESILALMNECGIKLSDLSTARGVGRMLALMEFSQRNPMGMNGLAEFVERVTGKGIGEFEFSDVIKLDLGMFANQSGKLNDRLATLFQGEGNHENRKVVDMLMGTRKFSDSGVAVGEIAELASAAGKLAAEPAGAKRKVTLKGIEVELEKRAAGSLSATIGGVRFHVGVAIADIVHFAEDMIVNGAGDRANAELAKKVLENAVREPLLRRRELAVKTLVSIMGAEFGVTSVRLASTSTDKLVQLAQTALAGDRSRAALEQVSAQLHPSEVDAYYSIDMVEMHREVVAAEREKLGSVDQVVKMNPSTAARNSREREEVTVAEDVHRLASDLLANADHWDSDEAAFGGKASVAGERLRRLLLQYEPELKHIRDNAALLDILPLPGADALKAIIRELAQFRVEELNDAGAVDPRLAVFETRLDQLADDVMKTVQQKVDALFAPRPNDGAELWQKTFSEISGAKGIDLSTPSGRFAHQVLSGYFIGSRTLDKRKMFAELLRYTDSKSSDVKIVSELLKGAGPLLQKILQGLPMETFPAETQLALADMKSRLPSIPDDAVKAQMYQLVQGSNGKILSIDVLGSYGAASVGQAFHCVVKTPAHPVIGVECVIKVLRPNAQVAIEREKALIDQLLEDEQRQSFAGQYSRILQELDFTLEAENVDLGRAIYEQPKIKAQLGDDDGATTYTGKRVHSMERIEGMNATMGTMIVKCAPGKTVDGYIAGLERDISAVLDRRDNPIRRQLALEQGGIIRMDYVTKDEGELLTTREMLAERRNLLKKRRVSLEQTVHAWFEKALFGTGFFHGDMHAGNVMFDDNGATIIDFGNCSVLSQADRALTYDLLVCGLCAVPDKLLDAVKERFGGDVAAQIDAIGANVLKAEFAEILGKGTSDDVLKRIKSVLSLLQKHGFNVPMNVANFFQSSVRLEGVLSAVDDEMARIDSIIGALHVEGGIPPELKFTGTADKVTVQISEVRYTSGKSESVTIDKELGGFFKTLDKVMEGIYGDPVNPPTSDSVKRLLAEHSMDVYAASAVTYRVLDELKGLDRAQVSALLDKLAKRFGSWNQLMLCIERMRGFFDQYFDEAESPNPDPKKLADLASTVNSRFRVMIVNEIHKMIVRTFSLTGEDQIGVNVTRGIEFADLASEVIYGHFDDLKDYMMAHRLSWGGLFVSVKVLGVVVRVSEYDRAMEHRNGVASRVRSKRGQLRNWNLALPREKRLTSIDIDRIEKTVPDFCAPLKSPFAEDGWMEKDANLTVVAKMVVDDLKRLAEALGRTTLSPETVNHAFELYSAYEAEEGATNFLAALKALKPTAAFATLKAKIAELADSPAMVAAADEYLDSL